MKKKPSLYVTPPVRTARDVLARITEHEHVAARMAPRIAQLHTDAEAVAAEHGHVLGEWYQSENLLTAARCTQCTATVCLKIEGSNGEPTRWLTGDCRPTQRFYAVKSSIAPATHFVRDRENPKQTIAMVRKATAVRALLHQLNGGDVVDEHAKAVAKVARLRTQLAKAEAALELVAT